MSSVITNPPAPASAHSVSRLKRKSASGFTMVEILMATFIMALIISLVMVILTQVMSAWNRSTDDMTFSTNARFVLDTITQDLQGCILHSDGGQWLSLTTDAPPKGSAIPSANDSRLIFFTNTAFRQMKDAANPNAVGKTIAGDICTVEYRVVYADPFGATSPPGSTSTTKTFSLHRVVLDPATTFFGINQNGILGLNNKTTPASLVAAFDNSVDLPSAATSPINNRTPTVSVPFVEGNEPGGPSALTIPINGAYSTASTLLDDVAQFTVYIYFNGLGSASDTEPTQVFPQSVISSSPTPSIFYGGSTTPTASNGYLDAVPQSPSDKAPIFLSLAFADVTLTLLTPDGVAILQQNNGAIPQGKTWPQFLQQYGKTFTQRIPLMIAPR